jgi:hypothetical protein
MRVVNSEEQILTALRRQGFDAEIVRSTFEQGSLVVLFTIEGTTGKRLGLTAYITARPGMPDGALEAEPRIDIFEGFV